MFFAVAVATVAGGWLVGVVVAAVGVAVVVRQAGWRSAVVLAAVAVLAFAGTARLEVRLGYPYLYYWAHRSQFSSVASAAARTAVEGRDCDDARLPAGDGGLAGNLVSVARPPDREPTVIVWMSYGSGIGYGYAYAPYARQGQTVVCSTTTVTARAALGDGWWWVSNVG